MSAPPAGHIVVIDDDRESRETLSELLQTEGYSVVECANGAIGLQSLRARSGAILILLDLMMPVMNGGEFRAAQLADATLATIPVIIFSGALDARGSVAADAFLSKPMPFDSLLATIKSVLDARQTGDTKDAPGSDQGAGVVR